MLVLLLLDHASGSTLSSVPLLRFRGGHDDDITILAQLKAQPPGPLSRDDVIEKLNIVPTFCIMQHDGSVISLPDMDAKGGDECCTWFTDASEARTAFKRITAANPDVQGLHLAMHWLGDVFATCNGFPDEVSDMSQKYDGTLKLQAPRQFYHPVATQLVRGMHQQGLNPGAWILPIFIGEHLAQTGPGGEQLLLPVYLDPNDMRAAYKKVGIPKHVLDRGPKIMDLRQFVGHMMARTNEHPNPWRSVQFIGSPDGAKLAHELMEAR